MSARPGAVRLRRILLGVSLALMLIMVASPHVLAQEAGEPSAGGEQAQFEVVGELPIPDEVTNDSDLWVWPEGDLGYFATGPHDASALDPPDERGLVAVDLDTFEVVAQTDGAEVPYLDETLPLGRNRVLAIDREGGRLYVAHHNLVELDSAVNRVRCGHGFDDDACFGGVYVLDAETLDRVGPGRLTFIPEASGPDQLGGQLRLASLRYSPPRGPGDEGKLHMLLYETTHEVAKQADIAANTQVYTRSARQYAAQMDIETGRTDWMVALSGCTGSPLQPEGRFGHAEIFRSGDLSHPAVWASCWAGGFSQSAVVRIDLEESGPDDVAVAGQQRFIGPGGAKAVRADPAGQRLLVKTALDPALWWVFDTSQEGFISRIGVGPFTSNWTADALGPDSGRLYTYAPPRSGATAADEHQGGLGYTDTRREELPQYRWVPSLRNPKDDTENNADEHVRIAVAPATETRPRRIFVRPGQLAENNEVARFFQVIEDRSRVTTDPPPRVLDRSDDVPPRPGATISRFSGSARGYGLRTVMLGGIDGVTDPLLRETILSNADSVIGAPCRHRNHDFVFGLAGSPAASQLALINDTGSATASARPAAYDTPTREDLGAPYSRCQPNATGFTFSTGGFAGLPEEVGIDPVSWEDVRSILVNTPEEPGVDTPGDAAANCAAPDHPEDEAGEGDAAAGFTARVSCEQGHIAGESRIATVVVGPITVVAVGSEYDVQRQPDGGIVATVESWARGVGITGEQGAAQIDAIRSTASAWATGRSQPEDAVENPNCDGDRTAGTCFRRSYSGVRITDAAGEAVFSCGSCEDEDAQQQLVEGLQQILGSGYLVSAPRPDEPKARGAADGASAAVLKPDGRRFADATLKADLLPTLPALEIVRVTDGKATVARQTYQFAGVEADVTFGIICLLTVIDGECQGRPASLEISLTDVDGTPLEGGLFQVQPDADGDGDISIAESVEEPLACTTGPDGTCAFDTIPAGPYVVHQATSPAGFLPASDTPIDLPEGAQARLNVVNGTPSVTGIAISLHDRSTPPQPLGGADFEVHTGVDLVGEPLAVCTTNANGVCEFDITAAGGIDPIMSVVGQEIAHVLQVPSGPYVIHQASAPEGYEPVDDIAFELPVGQIARVGLTNGVVAASQEVGPAPPPTEASDDSSGEAFVPTAQPSEEPVLMEAPQPVPQPQITINVQQPAQDPPSQVAGPEGNTYTIFQNPVQAAKLLLRDPKEAASFGAAWLLFGAAVAGAWRRRMILAQFDA